MEIKSLYTIGHSNDPIDHFIMRLKNASITAICDVRSQPYSRYASWFNKENIAKTLKDNQIAYVFLGDALGARCDDPNCKTDNKIDFTKVAQTEKFKSAIKRVHLGLRKFNVALMCSEKCPMTCHRTIMIAREFTREFTREALDIQHILPDNSILQHSKLMQNIAYENGYHNDLFLSDSEKINQSYSLQARKIGYIA